MKPDYPHPFSDLSLNDGLRTHEYDRLLAVIPVPAMLLLAGKRRRLNAAARSVPGQAQALAALCVHTTDPQAILSIQKQWICARLYPIGRRKMLICWYPLLSEGVQRTLRQLYTHRRNSRQFETSIAGLAHDIRTPLNIISGLSQLLGNEPAIPAQSRAQGWISLIRDESDQIGRLVEEVIDVVRINHGVLQPKRMMGNIIAHIHAQKQLLEPLFTSRSIRLELPDPSRQLMLRYDHLMFERMLQNLLSNAVRFTPQGGRVDICVDATEGGVRISITDNGCGIDPNIGKDIFELHKTGGGGYGLGLYLTRAMAQAHGGDITVIPQASGAHFLLTLMNG